MRRYERYDVAAGKGHSATMPNTSRMQTVEKLPRRKRAGVRAGPTDRVPSLTAAVGYYDVAVFWKWLSLL